MTRDAVSDGTTSADKKNQDIRDFIKNSETTVSVLTEAILEILDEAGINDEQVEQILENLVKWLTESARTTVNRLRTYRGTVQNLVKQATGQVRELQDEMRLAHGQIDARRAVLAELQLRNKRLDEDIRKEEARGREATEQLTTVKCSNKSVLDAVNRQREQLARVMKTDTDLMRKVSMAADGVMRLEERLANDVLRRDSLTAAEAETDAAIERATKDLDIKRERLASLERDGADVVKCLLNLEEDHRLRALELREKDVRDRCEASRGRILFLEGRLKEANLDVYDTTRHLAALNGFTLSANTHIVSTCCS